MGVVKGQVYRLVGRNLSYVQLVASDEGERRRGGGGGGSAVNI